MKSFCYSLFVCPNIMVFIFISVHLFFKHRSDTCICKDFEDD